MAKKSGDNSVCVRYGPVRYGLVLTLTDLWIRQANFGLVYNKSKSIEFFGLLGELMHEPSDNLFKSGVVLKLKNFITNIHDDGETVSVFFDGDPIMDILDPERN